MATNNEKTVRVTKSQRMEDIGYMLEGKPVLYGTTLPIALEFLSHERELLANKNKSSGKKKLTPTQEANEGYKKLILEYLATIPEDQDGPTCTEIAEAIPECAKFTPSKTSSLMRQLGEKGSGQVVRYEVKGKTRYKLAPASDVIELDEGKYTIEDADIVQ